MTSKWSEQDFLSKRFPIKIYKYPTSQTNERNPNLKWQDHCVHLHHRCQSNLVQQHHDFKMGVLLWFCRNSTTVLIIFMTISNLIFTAVVLPLNAIAIMSPQWVLLKHSPTLTLLFARSSRIPIFQSQVYTGEAFLLCVLCLSFLLDTCHDRLPFWIFFLNLT